ncbi:phosphomannomutase/phosphoglucomutase [Candidatus Collierbacteria bacterium CG10_big_fil_rev_8_21_14_0_10_44_9]|uniref:Phosphomannomutase/phosphoglucomutase n=1 Tax=Candidatus Collierbacteria bacterium CG10_big_fil_rev_8_21_14_0_10_44_9 TaxID=1974535 RepID=A0A2H0VJE7_9BACT|nr:MAG: phosphomannomutase/phosphoglucomutase [Candidatus Collierbacteria bacterium CG10_big_fil_rev_8_21_14_0_10_44_9]
MQLDQSIFKAYDIRGIYPINVDNDLAYQIGLAYAEYTKPNGEILVGEDVRLHSHELKESLIRGLLDAGVDVVDVGLISTDMYYFGVGNYKYAGGIQVTASHNLSEWHGFKMVKAGPVAMTIEEGIGQIRDLIQTGNIKPSKKKGNVRKIDLLDDFSDYILGWLNGVDIKPLKIVINPNFGFAGIVFHNIIKKGNLPIEIIAINDKPNGNFPKGRPDPYISENRTELCALVKQHKADLGITWDADADRVFFVSERGDFIDPYYVNTLLIEKTLKQYPKSTIIYEPRYQWATLDAIRAHGGQATLCQVGHSYIKQKMRQTRATFASESSGHTYYRDFWYADCGMIPAMQMLDYISTHQEKLSAAIAPVMNRYFISGEINTEIEDKNGKMNEIAEHYKDAEISRLDGVSVEYANWRFCVRPSNTEPLLRLTLEAKSQELMKQKRDEVLLLIRN